MADPDAMLTAIWLVPTAAVEAPVLSAAVAAMRATIADIAGDLSPIAVVPNTPAQSAFDAAHTIVKLAAFAGTIPVPPDQFASAQANVAIDAKRVAGAAGGGAGALELRVQTELVKAIAASAFASHAIPQAG